MATRAPGRLITVLVPALLAACAATSPAGNSSLPEVPSSGVSAEPSQAQSTPPAPESGTATVNGIDMYYEIHGSSGDPVVLLHGAYTTIDISFGQLLPILAQDRRVIAIEQQGHGRTEDIDRPLSYEQMADDTAALLRHLKIANADFFGYSMGGNVALEIAIRHPELVRKLAVASSYISSEGLYPGVLDGIAATKADDFIGSGLPEAYAAVAPDPSAWPTLVEKVKQLDLTFKGWVPEAIESIEAPTLIVIGDSDVVSPEHASRMFELLGGGVPGDFVGLPAAQLAVLPGTTHIGVIAERTELLASMLTAFLDAPAPVTH